MFVESHTLRSLLCCSVSLFHLGYCIIHGPSSSSSSPLHTHGPPFPPICSLASPKSCHEVMGGDREFNPQSGYKVKVNQKPFLYSFYARKKEKGVFSPSHLTSPHLTAVIVFPPHWNPSSFSDRCFATQSPSLSRSYHFP